MKLQICSQLLFDSWPEMNPRKMSGVLNKWCSGKVGQCVRKYEARPLHSTLHKNYSMDQNPDPTAW